MGQVAKKAKTLLLERCCVGSLSGALVTLAVALSFTGAAHAQEPTPPKTGPVYVVWIAPIDCPRQPEVSAEIDRLLGAQPRQSREGVEVRARVSRRTESAAALDPASSWHADLEIVSAGETETRAVDGESCAALAHAVAVIAAVASDASSTPREPPPPPAAFFAAGMGALDIGTLPRAALGIDVAIGWRSHRLELGLDGMFFVGQHATSPRPDAGADFSLFRIRARGCGVVLTLDRFTLAPCGVLGLDTIHASGTGSDRPADVSSTVLSLGAELIARVRLSSLFSIRAAGGLAAPLGRPIFSVVGAGAIHRPAAVAAPLTLGVEIDF